MVTERRSASASNHEEDTMERFPWQPRVRHAANARPLVIAAVTALAVAILAAAGIAATSRVSVAPTNTQPPVVSGTPEVGKNLTTTNGTWSGTTPLTFTYQWRRCDKTGGSCADISGATDEHVPAEGCGRRRHAACRRRRQERGRHRQRDQRPDRCHRHRAGVEQRLPCQQEREDCADRRALAARADPDHRLQGDDRTDQQADAELLAARCASGARAASTSRARAST